MAGLLAIERVEGERRLSRRRDSVPHAATASVQNSHLLPATKTDVPLGLGRALTPRKRGAEVLKSQIDLRTLHDNEWLDCPKETRHLTLALWQR